LKGAIEKKNQFNKRLKKNKDQIEKITFLKLGLNNEIEKKIKILQKKKPRTKIRNKKNKNVSGNTHKSRGGEIK
jgi:hypothetical protein